MRCKGLWLQVLDDQDHEWDRQHPLHRGPVPFAARLAGQAKRPSESCEATWERLLSPRQGLRRVRLYSLEGRGP